MSQPSKLLVIIGVTGLQGSSVYTIFKNEPGWRIRGITRSPEKHAHLKAENVELMTANLDDVNSLKKAFDGASAIFAVTDFWQFLKQPSTFERAEKEGAMPNEIAMALEIEQGKNIIHAAAAQLADLDRLVLSTLSDSLKWSNGEIKHNYHFDSKAAYTRYLKEQFPDLAAKTSYLYVGYYLSNWRMGPAFAPQKQEDGSFLIPQYQSDQGSKLITWVDPANDVGHFVKALVLKNPAGVSMLGYSQATSHGEYCNIWGKVHGVRTRGKFLKFDDLVAAGLPEWMALETVDTGLYAAKHGLDGGDPEVKRPEELGVDVSLLSNVEDVIRKDDWSSVL